MLKTFKQSVVCATIAGLFVLAAFAQRQFGLLGPEDVRVAVGFAAVLPPAPVDQIVADGPIFPPDPVDIPAVAAAQDGPIFPPDPIDIPRS